MAIRAYSNIYEFPEKIKFVKVNDNNKKPTREGMFIGNDNDVVTWIDFRYENLPMLCFGCGLIEHNTENCNNIPIPIEGGTNPRGAWLRSRSFGRRIIERKENTFRSNPLKSISGGQFSPIPKTLLHMMAAMSLKKQNSLSSGQQYSKSSPSPVKSYSLSIVSITQQGSHLVQDETMIPLFQQAIGNSNNITLKRKINHTATLEATTADNSSNMNTMAGLDYKAQYQ